MAKLEPNLFNILTAYYLWVDNSIRSHKSKMENLCSHLFLSRPLLPDIGRM